MTELQRIEFPFPVGSWVELYEDVSLGPEKGVTASVIFEGTVAQHVPETGLLRFEENEVGRAEFLRLLEKADGYEVLANYE